MTLPAIAPVLPISHRDACWSTSMLEETTWSPASQPGSSQQDECWSTWLSEEDPWNAVSQPEFSCLEMTPASQHHHECWSTWLVDEDPWDQAQLSRLEQQSRSQSTGDDEWCRANDVFHQPSWANEDDKQLLPKLEMPIISKDRESRKMLFPRSFRTKLPTSFMTGSVWETRMDFLMAVQDSIKVSNMSLCSTPSMPPDSQTSQSWSDSKPLDSQTSQSLTPSMPPDSQTPLSRTPSMPPDSPTAESESEPEMEAPIKPRTIGAIWYRRHLKLEEASNPFCLEEP